MTLAAVQTQKASPAPGRGVLQRQCACGQHTEAGGECAECRKKRLAQQHRAIAETPPSLQQEIGRASGQTFGHDFSQVSTHAIPTRVGQVDAKTMVHGTSRDAGRGLEPSLARRFYNRLGSLVDQVRIHLSGQGAQFAMSQQAAAVTRGRDIYFAPGAYQPHTSTGQDLLAHELAHVHQQHSPNGPPSGYRSHPGDVYEREADRFARTGLLNTSQPLTNPESSNIRQQRTAAEQIASIIRTAVEGWGTDEDAIFNALTGRTPAEIADIAAAYKTLSGGETLEERLWDELSGDELSLAMSLLGGETPATETARRLWDAMRGLGTDESSIYATIAGRTAAEWTDIQNAYLKMTGSGLLTDLRGELNDDEWARLQSLLPNAAGGAATPEDRATVIANLIEAAVQGAGTDEDAIYAALTGRSEPELREIEKRYKLLTQEDMDVRLRSELNDGEYARVQQLLHPVSNPTRIAMRLRDAVQGPGTGEGAILAILSGRSPADLALVRSEYQRIYNESLRDRLIEELSGGDKIAALKLLQSGVLEPEDEIKLAVEGLGTDEERLFAVLRELRANPDPVGKIQTVAQNYRAKGYGDLYEDVYGDLSGDEKKRAKQLLTGVDVFSGTHAVTPTEHARIEGIMRPGSTVTITPGVGGAAPTITVTSPPAMTGAGVGGPFEVAMLDSLKKNVGEFASQFRALKAQPGQPAFPIAGANTIAKTAQRETENFFAPYINVATRTPTDTYHPGAYSLTTQIGDQSTRPISDAGSAAHPGRIGWTIYWSTLSECPKPPCGQKVLNDHSALPSRSPDDVEVNRVIHKFATDPANQTDIDDAIHGWPAEATGGVFIQPYVSGATTDQLRFARWDLFTTLIHEMMHILVHPNFSKTANAIGGTPQKYMMEGFADVMRHDLWDGTGSLKSRLATDELKPLRRDVEGAEFPYNEALVHYHPDYPEYAQANDIVKIVGLPNAKAAYFLGHTDLLGLGQGTQAQAPLAGIGLYQGTDAAQASTVVAQAGDTYASIQARTNAPSGGILDTSGTPLVPGAAIAAGTQVRVPGIRWIRTIQNDTLGNLARQNNVSVADLIEANSLPPGTSETHAFPVDTRVLVPIHTGLAP